ncbi:D-alanyl-D-alanine carboxypeptidase/D-alanyl-D-alanine endopeptidase [Salipaludibacillus sp. CF4.18]|uniref:D-alanyl-D-alanine carboxypeptidase/D-alanyl-D-alanine endopeptidase n=1 Tax=Salipaludibacillus sp. CF4.18 TaxID=3373081 RepID=UPI003EE4AA29
MLVTANDSNLSAEQQLNIDLLAIVQSEELDSALPAVHVQSSETEDVLFAYHEKTSVVPASGQKLLTGAAALDTLGRDYTFTTGVYTDGKQIGEVLKGNLFLKGKGDPTMLPKDYEKLAEEIAECGIKVIQGDLIADDTFFDDMRLSLDMSWCNQRSVTAAQVSALTLSPDKNYNAGSVIVEVIPGGHVGDKTEAMVFPDTDYITVLNEVETVKKDESRNIDWGREHGNNDIFLKGVIPSDGETWRNGVAIWEPTELVRTLFHEALEYNGVEVKGNSGQGETPEDARELAVRKSMTLEEMFDSFMKLSNNSIAEVLTKTMGQEVKGEGSWDAGLEVIEEYLLDAGLNTDVIQLRDGSGMSHLNKIPVNEMTQLLQHVKKEEWFDIYYQSLPIAAADGRMVGGTLENRMEGSEAAGKVHAKTGTITSKTSLSGYVTTKDDEELIFSIIINNFIGDAPKEVEDKIVVRLSEFSRSREE